MPGTIKESLIRQLFTAVSVFTGITGNVAYCQNITVSTSEWAGSGIEVIPASSSAFTSLIGPSLSPLASPNIQAFFPYSFVLRNKTAHTIIAYSSKWRCTASSGAVKQRGNLHVNFSTLGAPEAIPPSMDRLVTPVLGLGYQPGPDAATLSSVEAKVLPLYISQQSIEISLDAVIFDDGTLAGPDTYNAGTRLQAFSDAIRDLNATVLSGIGQGSGTVRISSYLSGLAANSASNAARNSSAPTSLYQKEYRVWQRSRAGLYSQIVAEQGFTVLTAGIRRQTAAALPPIHR